MTEAQLFPTVVHMLADAAQKAPTHEALVMGGERLNYQEYARCAAGLEAELREYGASGGRVVLIMTNTIDTAIAFFGVYAAGAQVVALNPAYTARELGQKLEDAEASIIIYSVELADKVEPLASDIEHHIVVGSNNRRLIEWRDQQGLENNITLPDPDSLATIQFTGGTTGRSKGVNLSHRAVAYNQWQREQMIPTRAGEERLLCITPLFHSFAIHIGTHSMVHRRGTMVIMPKYHPAAVTEALEKERITIVGGSPTIFNSLLTYDDFLKADLSALHFCYSGASALSVERLMQWEEATGAPVVENYGQSEAGVITCNPLYGVRKRGSVGVCVPEADVQIVDLDIGENVLPAGQSGEIRVRGPQIMTGYRNLPVETAETLRNGWLYTGDIGELDEDGYLFIRDRKKEMVIVSGFNVYPREVEEVLYSHSAIREAAVIGKPDEYRGEILCAYIVAPDPAITSEDIETYCKDNLTSYKVPSEINMVSELPKTAVGKIDKKALSSE